MVTHSLIPILVTGGAGYVGSHACKELAASGYLPIVYDNLIYGHREAVQWGPLEVGDLADRTLLNQVIDRYRPQAVMHFAAFTYVGESIADPGKYYRNNVGGTLTLLEAMRDHSIERLIFSSTAATYGTPEVVPIPEEATKAPINPYGHSKLVAEQMISDFASAHRLRATCLRYFNAAGADPDGEIGENHVPEAHLIPLALQAITGDASPLQIFGDDYPTPDGTCIRDYIHVCDLADAHVQALGKLEDREGADAFNLGTGQGSSVRAVLAAIEAITGKTVPHSLADRRSGDPAELVSNPAKAMRELGWKPVMSDLHSIISTAWAWHLKCNAHRGRID
ncbi:UDP-glucose 4-epimerase GalE [Sphingomonas sp.]|uniref:UDP-glucose 4-epimerase GalE n=1 Tax=Sphingomonas sp. TaxID=28214 RepID=UPI00286B1AD2|nr:UDP-glucose 4-epimerase GalE [Sphingomonas sp.]